MSVLIPDCHEPEMLRAPLDKVILDTKLLDMGPPIQLLSLAMTQPRAGNIYKCDSKEGKFLI